MNRRTSKLILFLVTAVLIAAVPVLVFAQPADPECPAGTVCLKNPLAVRGINEPGQLILQVIGIFSGIMGAATIAFTVFTAFKLVIATDEESIKSAREGVLWSVLGFCISILSFTAIAGVSKILGYEPKNTPNDLQIWNPIGPLTGNRSDFISVANFIMVNFLGLLGFAATLMIVYHGYRYMTSGGNEEAIEKAKTGLRWAVSGVAIVLLVFTIISAVRKYLIVGV